MDAIIVPCTQEKDAARLDVARKLGADHAIDVQQEDALTRIMEIPGGRGVDVVLTIGDIRGFSTLTEDPVYDHGP